MLSTTDVKILVLSGLFILTFLCSLLPLKLVKIMDRARQRHDSVHTRNYQNVFSILSCYAAGVFLATCLLDLFPEAKEKMENALDRSNIITTYPLPEFVLSFGLFLMILMEQMVLVMKNSSDEHRHEESKVVEKEVYRQPSNHQSSINGDSSHGFENMAARENQNLLDPAPSTSGYGAVSYAGASSSNQQSDDHGDDQDHDHCHDIDLYLDPSSHSIIRALILLLALSLHSLFEGLAVGLQTTNRAVLQISTALFLHKGLLAFSLGVSLAQSKMSTLSIMKANLTFCIMSPIGIGIGIAVIDFASDSIAATMVNGVLQGIASGTFVYIVFFEILPHEFNSANHHPNRMLKVLFLILGYATVAVLLFLDPSMVSTRVDT